MNVPDVDCDFTYEKIFDCGDAGPQPVGVGHDAVTDVAAQVAPLAATALGDQVPPLGYRFTADTELAINVALAARRPLLVRGEPGCGKSTLAPAVAKVAGWDFLSVTVTSRTRAQDLLWTFDAIRRLRDAQAGQGRVGRHPTGARLVGTQRSGPERSSSPRLKTGGFGAAAIENLRRYVRPGVFWWALAPENAAAVHGGIPPTGPRDRAVLLLDEIDKAEPDVPNDLLAPMGTLSFEVTDLDGHTVRHERAYAPLIVVTTNEERDLPPAFVRRCVVLSLEFPTEDGLVDIGRRHFPGVDEDLLEQAATVTGTARKEALAASAQPPGTAEYLDAVRAATGLGVTPGGTPREWERIRRLTLAKWARPERA